MLHAGWAPWRRGGECHRPARPPARPHRPGREMGRKGVWDGGFTCDARSTRARSQRISLLFHCGCPHGFRAPRPRAGLPRPHAVRTHYEVQLAAMRTPCSSARSSLRISQPNPHPEVTSAPVLLLSTCPLSSAAPSLSRRTIMQCRLWLLAALAGFLFATTDAVRPMTQHGQVGPRSLSLRCTPSTLYPSYDLPVTVPLSYILVQHFLSSTPPPTTTVSTLRHRHAHAT